MAVFSGPKIPNNNSVAVYFDAKNPKSNDQSTKIWSSLYGDYSANIADVNYDNGYFIPSYDTVLVQGQSIPSGNTVSIITAVSSTASSTGAIFAIQSGSQQIYTATSNTGYDSVDFGANVLTSFTRTIDYNTSIQNTTYSSIDFEANVITAISRTIDYNTSIQNTTYSSIDYEANVLTSFTRTIDYNTSIQNTTYSSIDYEASAGLITSYIDNFENDISVYIDGTVLKLRFKQSNSEINLLENFTPSGNDIVSVVCGVENNTYVVSLYLNDTLLKSANVAAYGNQLTTGNIAIFSNRNYAKYTNTPTRIFNIYNKQLSSNDVSEFNVAFKSAL